MALNLMLQGTMFQRHRVLMRMSMQPVVRKILLMNMTFTRNMVWMKLMRIMMNMRSNRQ